MIFFSFHSCSNKIIIQIHVIGFNQNILFSFLTLTFGVGSEYTHFLKVIYSLLEVKFIKYF